MPSMLELLDHASLSSNQIYAAMDARQRVDLLRAQHRGK
jgi:hypothetical protein